MKNIGLKILATASALLILCSCGKTPSEKYETTDNGGYEVSSTAPVYNFQTEGAVVQAPETTSPVQFSQPDTQNDVAVTETAPATPPVTKAQTVSVPAQITTQWDISETTEKVYQKTGKMAFSDSPDNKYIKAVSTKYGVNSTNLVALYTVPDNDGNIVLQFDGSRGTDGKLLRNADTLVAIYSVDKNLNSKCASENRTLNEYSYGEMKVMFISVTKYIMPEFQDELNG